MIRIAPHKSDFAFFRRAVTPADCEVLMAIPTSEAAFERDLWDEQKDFIRNQCPVWRSYESIVRVYERARDRWQRQHVAVLEDVTLDIFRERLHARARTITILFAHWAQDAVEFADRIVPIAEVVDAVPADYDGLLDLSVCHPGPLASALSTARPRSLTKVSDLSVTPELWIGLYTVVFTLLAHGARQYVQAIEEAVERLTA
jgi:hypothetical protein